MDYDAARRRHLGPIMDHQSPYGGQGGMPGPVPLGRGGHPGMDPNGKAVYRNRQEEMRDPDFHRPRWVSYGCRGLYLHSHGVQMHAQVQEKGGGGELTVVRRWRP